jgi:hypothetical protein
MSLVKSPIAAILLFSGTPQRGFLSPVRRCSVGWTNRTIPALFRPAWLKRRDGTGTSRSHENAAKYAQAAIRNSGVTAYVRRVTAIANKGRSGLCQGLHNARFLPYGSFYVKQSSLPVSGRFDGPYYLLPPCREEECIDC